MILENGLTECNCPKKKCVRHGNCAECIEHHGKSNKLPYCKRGKAKKAVKWFKKDV